MYKFETDSVTMVFFNKSLDKYIPHIARMNATGVALHNQIWKSQYDSPIYKPDAPLLFVTEWQDDGNAGVNAFPISNVQIEMSPLNNSFFVSPSTERYYHLFCHEQTHVVMTDKANTADMRWRKFFGNKVAVDNMHPLSAVWSYFTTPRWYAPRWYHEGIACYLETWLCGGLGRSLGGYDEMYFRSFILENEKMSSVVGLESEGSTTDFQLGTNAYLYGTRFVNYLSLTYGVDSLRSFYNRTEGSAPFFATQFKKVYGESVRDVWKQWQDYEAVHQKENIAAVSEFPLTEVKPVTKKAMGSVSAPVYDAKRDLIYTAVNYPGDFARIVSIDRGGKVKRLAYIDDPRLYTPSYVALDTIHDRLIYTTQNQNYRGLRAIDLKTGRQVHKSNFRRLSCLVYDNTKDCMYALFTNAGILSLVRIGSDLKTTDVLYAFSFGKEVFDLDVSHDGSMISATIIGKNGEQDLIVFNVDDLKTANYNYRTLVSLDNCNLSGFRFSLDDKRLIGSSYYTGVSNIWSVDVENGRMSLLSNTVSGLFNPLEFAKDSLMALEFKRDGLQPVLLSEKEIHDANSVTLLGQKVFEKDPERLSAFSQFRTPHEEIPFEKVFNNIEGYKPVKEMKLCGAYPDISAFVDRKAWNNMTPVIGYTFKFQDPMMLSSMTISVGTSPWSNNDWVNKFHFDWLWDYKFWHFSASWNHTDFYDLFGPIRGSRKGYAVKAGYTYKSSILAPLQTRWGVRLSAYGLTDELPVAQEIRTSAEHMQSLAAFASIRKCRKSLGGVKDEQGWEFGTTNYLYQAGGKFYPFISATANGGVLLPVLRNTALWWRNTAGYNCYDDGSEFSYTYFGGFQNNYVDRYSDFRGGDDLYNWYAMPGAKIDEIKARSFLRSSLTLDIQPIRFKNVGALSFYPTWMQFSPFGGMLLTGGDNMSAAYFNYGIQMSVEVVLFNYMKTNWNLGYGRIHATGNFPVQIDNPNEFMFSLKIL